MPDLPQRWWQKVRTDMSMQEQSNPRGMHTKRQVYIDLISSFLYHGLILLSRLYAIWLRA